MIDWKMDTTKRLNNLVRFIKQDVTSRGDASALCDDPRVVDNEDGSFTVFVFGDKKTDAPLHVPTTKKKAQKPKKVTVEDDSSE